MQRRVATVIHGVDIGAQLGQKVDGLHPGVRRILTEVASPPDAGGHHQGGGATKGRKVGVGLGRQQETHRLDVTGLRRPPERCRPGRIDPQPVVRRRAEPQPPRDPCVGVGARVEQRGQQLDGVNLFLVGSWIGRPGHRREAHVDRGIQRGQPVDVGDFGIGTRVEQILPHAVVPVGDRDHQGARAVATRHLVHERAALDQGAHRVEMTVSGREEQRGHPTHHGVPTGRAGTTGRERIAIVVEPRFDHGHHPRRQSNVRPMLDQSRDHIGPVFPGGEHQGRLTVGGFACVHEGAVAEQRANRVDAPGCRGRHQRCRAGRGGRVHTGTRPNEHLDHRGAAVGGRHGQGRDRADARGNGRTGLGFDEGRRKLEVIVECRPVQRGHAVTLRDVHVGSARQQRPHCLRVTVHGRIGDRRIGRQRGRREQTHRDGDGTGRSDGPETMPALHHSSSSALDGGVAPNPPRTLAGAP